ncbi:MAG: single-stranded-DNA-specific exonuclease RecJ [Clostridia bacterium]|nr:single-stranded-DNA-specific exonuclease RecJ [Clostridia bacterium]
MNSIIKELLAKRGLTTEEEISEFLSDKPKLTYSPALLPDIEEGTDLIIAEAKKGSRILIYGDYDADGITSTALMYTVLSKLTDKENISYYIPSRFEEGYGLNMDAVKQFKEDGVEFMVTVDCGSVSYEEVELAKKLGIKVLVTDHHNITDKMADCLVINPKRPDSSYPFKELSGCGVAFKVCQRLREKADLDRSLLTEVLDLVLIGTVGDIMPLVDENRTLVKFGLRAINSGNRKGLNHLISRIGLSYGQITSENIGFAIVPHLNASGRMEHAGISVELLLSNDDEKIEKIVSDLIGHNYERKRLQQQAFEKGREILEGHVEDFNIIRLDDQHEGILGIVAGKLKDAYRRPVAIVSPKMDGNMELKGTGRSTEKFDIYAFLKKYDEDGLFSKFGGHSGACGFTVSEKDYPVLKERIREDMKNVDKDIFSDELAYDLDVEEKDLTPLLAAEMRKLEPFGKGNRKPKFRVKIKPVKQVVLMGENKKHFKFMSSGISFVLFNNAKEYDVSRLYEEEFHVVGTYDIQLYRGEAKPQFVIDRIVF